MRIVVSNIPGEASERHARKAIGASIRMAHANHYPYPGFIFWRIQAPRAFRGPSGVARGGAPASRDSGRGRWRGEHGTRAGNDAPCAWNGCIFFLDEYFGRMWLDAFGRSGRRDQEIFVKGYPLRLELDPTPETRDPRRAAALAHLGSSGTHDHDSDYYEEEEDENQRRLYVAELACGNWDEDGHFAMAWSRAANTNSEVTLEAEEGRLVVGLDDELVHIPLWTLEKMVFSAPQYLYLPVRVAPSFLRRRDDRRLLRLPALDEGHERCAQLSYVYRVRFSGGNTALNDFIKRSVGRLVKPRELQVRVKNIVDTFSSANFERLDREYAQLPFEVAFQTQVLVSFAYLPPRDVLELVPEIRAMEKRLGTANAVQMLRKVQDEIPWPSPGRQQNSKEKVRKTLGEKEAPRIRDPDALRIHVVKLTPCGAFPEGPNVDSGNRIVRTYPGMAANFLRARLTDEQDNQLWDSERIVMDAVFDRFRRLLSEGISVAGRRFHFLAFSTSGLREQNCWMVRRFNDPRTGNAITASVIRDGIGDLQHIRNPARFAARMGQAFTTTMHSVIVPAACVKTINDVERNGFCFSDGVGTVSQEVAKQLRGTQPNLPTASEPGVFQIRAGGAKGVLAVDTRLEGIQVNLRPSMTKFESHEGDGRAIEVVDIAYKPRRMHLNRPLVALLESLGCRADVFLRIQRHSMEELRFAGQSLAVANDVHRDFDLGTVPRLRSICDYLHVMGMNPLVEVPFIRFCNETALSFALRQIKFRARIPVPNCFTLMGILDETGELREGEVYACLRDPLTGQRKFLRGRCLVTRPPMVYPGDIQFATLVGSVAPDHPFYALTNCIIFSQQGARDLPSQLAGGDLDGDHFNIIQEPALMKIKTEPAADFARMKERVLERPCTAEDVIDFFLEYIQKQRLGVIATAHLLASDRMYAGVRSDICRRLAELQAIAVDYPKTGIPANASEIPTSGGLRPDYMQPEWRVERVPGQETRPVPSKKPFKRERNLYYNSEKALGMMFRAVDVGAALEEWSAFKPPLSAFGWMDTIRDYCLRAGQGEWAPKGNLLRQLRAQLRPHVAQYYVYLFGIRRDFSPERRGELLSEEEVFMGCVLGRGPYHRGTKREDLATSIKDEFQHLVDFTHNVIVRSEGRGGRQWDRDLQLDQVQASVSADKRASERVRFVEIFRRAYAFFEVARDAEVEKEENRSACVVALLPLFRSLEALETLDRLEASAV